MKTKKINGIRVGLKQVHGISRAEMESIVKARARSPFVSLRDFCQRTSVSRPVIENLILCGAFDSIHPHRRELLVELDEIFAAAAPAQRADERMLLYGEGAPPLRRRLNLPEPTLAERVRWEVELLGLCVHTHPTVLFRKQLAEWKVAPVSRIQQMPDGAAARVAGVVLCRMRPPTRSGAVVVFITLEDETGLIDTVLFPRIYEKYGSIAFGSDLLVVEGKVQRLGRRDLAFIALQVFNPMAGASPVAPDGRTGKASRQISLPSGLLPRPVQQEFAGDEEDSFHEPYPEPRSPGSST